MQFVNNLQKQTTSIFGKTLKIRHMDGLGLGHHYQRGLSLQWGLITSRLHRVVLTMLQYEFHELMTMESKLFAVKSLQLEFSLFFPDTSQSFPKGMENLPKTNYDRKRSSL
jgi:hypothetical protein